MKNVQDIITSIQYKPQFKKILHHKCIYKLMSTILPAIRKNVKHGFISKNILYITISAALNKYDRDNIIKTIKMMLNPPEYIDSQQFCECEDIQIDDVIVYVDHKPKTDFTPFTTQVHKLTYFERASGDITIDIKDEKLHDIAKQIQEMIKKETNDT